MKKIKYPAAAGTFYPNNALELKKQIEFFAQYCQNDYTYASRAVIVPHAGLIYSGRLAYEGISLLDRNLKNLFIFAPAHRVGFEGLSLSGFELWQTPLGEIEVNQQINNELKEKFNAQFFDKAFEYEHSIEVQLPLIQSVFKNVKIIPLLAGSADYQVISQIIKYYYDDKENGFIISSDLSHFLTDEKAKRIDAVTADMIETGNIDNFQYEQACGALGIAGLVDFANKKNYSLIRIGMHNSGLTTGDKTRVVGYGSWFLYEGQTNEFIKKYYSKLIIDICRQAIKSKFEPDIEEIKYPQVFGRIGACFVTLEKNNTLRGCIGSVIARRPLINDIIMNAKNSAFSDPRFLPVQQNEISQLKIAVSILSEPKKMSFTDENDLLRQMRPNIDGIIIKDGIYQAVYLPSVWEQLPDKREFLETLKVKAGLNPDYFSDTFEAYRFETVYIKEN